MDETYLKVGGRWQYLYRAVDRDGDTVDFLLTARRDRAAARRFLERAIALRGQPKRITIDKFRRWAQRLRGEAPAAAGRADSAAAFLAVPIVPAAAAGGSHSDIELRVSAECRIVLSGATAASVLAAVVTHLEQGRALR